MPASSATATGRNTTTGSYTDIGVEELSPRPGFRDVEVEHTLSIQKSAPVLTSAAISAPISSFPVTTSGQVREDLEQQPRQMQDDGGGITGNDSGHGSHHHGRAGISSLGGSVLRRLEPNRLFESRRKRNVDRDRDREWEWQRRLERDVEKKRERSRGRAILPVIVGAAGKNTKFGTPFSSVAPPAPAPAPAPSPLLSNPSSSWWEASRDGDGVEKERARHWI